MWDRLPAYGQDAGDEYLLLDPRRVQLYHNLCRQAGVDSELRTLPDVWEHERLGALLARNARLIATARDNLLNIHRLLARRTHVFILTDTEPRVLDLVAATEVNNACVRIGLCPGACLSERSCGTNAAAIALRQHEPVAMRGLQHYCKLFHDWLQIAAPIIGETGELLGSIVLAVPAAGDLAEKFALVTLYAWRLQACMHAADTAPSVTPQALPLTARQRHIGTLLVAGFSYKKIAASLGITPRTVESHIENMRKSLHVRTTLELVVLLTSSGIRADKLQT